VMLTGTFKAFQYQSNVGCVYNIFLANVEILIMPIHNVYVCYVMVE